MILFSDPKCLQYQAVGHPERPTRVEKTVSWLKEANPSWSWGSIESAPIEALLRAHPETHLERLQEPRMFDADTAYFEDIFDISRLGTGGALAAMSAALEGNKAFSLMRPPGHHAESEKAMGFCYLNHIAIAVFEALASGIDRVAVWDFDAHHGNGTEAILEGVERTLYVSVHQHPCYPGTGLRSRGNVVNFPVPPGTPSETHMGALEDSWSETLAFKPSLILVSAGFDAYEADPLTEMRLGIEDYRSLGAWIERSNIPAAAILEGGYSDDLPLLVDAFLKGWSGP